MNLNADNKYQLKVMKKNKYRKKGWINEIVF